MRMKITYTAVDDQSHGSQWVLNVLGRLCDFDIYVDIARADYCYGYNNGGGCERWEQPGCRHVDDQFEIQQGYFQAITSSASTFTSNSNSSQGYSDCKATCWNYCGCLGFNYRFSNQTGCQFWTGNWKFIEDLTDDDSRIFVYTTKPTPTINEYEWRWIGTGIAVALLVIMFFILSHLLRRRNFLPSGKRFRMSC